MLAHFQKVIGHDALEVVAVNFKEPRRDFLGVLGKDIASDKYGVQSLPNMFVIDRDGRIAHVHRGYSPEMLEGFIEEIMALLPEEVLKRPAAG